MTSKDSESIPGVDPKQELEREAHIRGKSRERRNRFPLTGRSLQVPDDGSARREPSSIQPRTYGSCKCVAGQAVPTTSTSNGVSSGCARSTRTPRS